jgi:hypothetical protein
MEDSRITAAKQQPPLHRDLIWDGASHFLVLRNKEKKITNVLAFAQEFPGVWKVKSPEPSKIPHPDVKQCLKGNDYLLTKNRYIIARLFPDEALPPVEELRKFDTFFQSKKARLEKKR